MAKINQLLYNGAGAGAAASGNYVNSSPYFISTSGVGSTPGSLTSFTFTNLGPSGAIFNGATVPSGQDISFVASPGTKFSPISYDANGNTVLIAGSRLI